ncbi:hypothetical protein [Endozoicomonas euniceicola]|uniref:Uncharacterized protein n=1 Tax=Endozoicomonas euniceicola TaxID=1234143 RepID=A0ABY6GPT5_9GAMM|nr:hypothetical protein [Endozoicomonas euniceicola]UYM14113.1 hypothetical protein NX720_14480 [Endozoicomonas euniceicola]
METASADFGGFSSIDRQVESFAQPQSHAVSGEYKCANFRLSATAQQSGKLIGGENVWQPSYRGWLDDVNELSRSFEYKPVEKLRAVTISLDGTPCL